jgi:hypothetical protein
MLPRITNVSNNLDFVSFGNKPHISVYGPDARWDVFRETHYMSSHFAVGLLTNHVLTAVLLVSHLHCD